MVVGDGFGGGPRTGWAAIRPVLVGLALAVDAFVVAALGITRPGGWVPPFVAFGAVLVGLAWFWGWSVRHRHDDDPGS